MRKPPLRPGGCYHIYNRGINRGTLFFEERNYQFFLRRYAFYIEPVAETFAYCLLPNHFHLLARVKRLSEQEQTPPRDPVRAFSNLFNSYAKAVNKAYGRTGSLFEKGFRRKTVTSAAYFRTVLRYIHRNPQHHGLVGDFRDYPHSSFQPLLHTGPVRLNRAFVMEQFGDTAAYHHVHAAAPDRPASPEIAALHLEGW